ncbi:hypothetical protein Nepgr_028462 [Nepenthes gracilis]|uniref:Cytochrome P450 n=1 Tax=Nepenthes gracilis TaxID=150966 RepID=A0AAD3TCB3_NEPGR|nr:hypothetical protein Nepgr_028462 [Nepenthes gracilis]
MTIYFEKLMNLFNNIIDKRLQAKDSGSIKANDILDSLLQSKLENGQVIERSYISHLLLDIFTAGTDTTSSTIEWAMAELLRHPDKLKKAQVELEQFIGKENIVEEGDTTKLPYLQVIMKKLFGSIHLGHCLYLEK